MNFTLGQAVEKRNVACNKCASAGRFKNVQRRRLIPRHKITPTGGEKVYFADVVAGKEILVCFRVVYAAQSVLAVRGNDRLRHKKNARLYQYA